MKRRSRSIDRAVLIGDIPGAIYEVWQDNRSTYFEFPSDLFFMDLDGIFEDIDGNGKYDVHTGNRSPEIWIGRIKASNMSQSEESLVERYFAKNHAYRTGILKLPERALIYVDDEWSIFGSSLAVDVALAIQDCMVVSDNETTNANNYLLCLSQNWSLVHLMAHGSSTMHAFQTNGNGTDVIDYRNISTTNYRCFFYNFFSCWNGEYNVKDYLGGWYIFSDNYGLAVVCSTRPGGMWFASDFYANLKNHTIGQAFREWLEKRILVEDQDPTWYTENKWFSGMTILGDPTLTLRMTPVAYRTDLNKDRTVNILDISIAAKAFRAKPGDENWNVLADLDQNGEVNIIDITKVAIDYGKTV